MKTPPITTTREAVLEQVSVLSEMRRGTLSEQYFIAQARQKLAKGEGLEDLTQWLETGLRDAFA